VGLRRDVPDRRVILVRNTAIHGEEDDDLEHPAQEQEECGTTMIGFEFP
jgi:hypothetical protein